MPNVLNLQRLTSTTAPISGNEYLISTFSGICPIGPLQGGQEAAFQE